MNVEKQTSMTLELRKILSLHKCIGENKGSSGLGGNMVRGQIISLYKNVSIQKKLHLK